MSTATVAPITRKKTIKHIVNKYGLRCGRRLYTEFEQKSEALLRAICNAHVCMRGQYSASSVSCCTHQPPLDLSPVEDSHAVSSTSDHKTKTPPPGINIEQEPITNA